MTTTIGLIGEGHIGSQIARLAVSHGFYLVIAGDDPGAKAKVTNLLAAKRYADQ
jgi:phosphoglycerate dehydrogenase-like enzyme